MKRILEKKIIRFIVSGGTAALTEYTTFLLLENSGVLLILANSISFLCGLLVSFLLNRRWVFTSSGNISSQFASYFALAVINLLLSNTLIHILTQAGVYVLVAKLICMVAIATWNYFIFSKFIFKTNN